MWKQFQCKECRSIMNSVVVPRLCAMDYVVMAMPQFRCSTSTTSPSPFILYNRLHKLKLTVFDRYRDCCSPLTYIGLHCFVPERFISICILINTWRLAIIHFFIFSTYKYKHKQIAAHFPYFIMLFTVIFHLFSGEYLNSCRRYYGRWIVRRCKCLIARSLSDLFSVNSLFSAD